MGNPQEVGRLSITGGAMASAGAAILVKSANAEITLDHAGLTPADGVLVRSIVNDDPNRTKVSGGKVPGITVDLRDGGYTGSILHEDSERPMTVTLDKAQLSGAIDHATVTITPGSRWTATADSTVTLAGAASPDGLDAPAGVTIRATAGPGTSLSGRYPLAGGGVLVVGG
jgi:hypothetical protein